MATTKELRDQLETKLKAARDIAAAVEAEGRDFSGEEREQVQAIMADAKSVKDQLAQRKSDRDMLAAIADLGGDIGLTDDAERPAPSGFQAPAKGASLGETFVKSAEFGALLGQFPDGNIPAKARVQSNPVGFKSLFTGASATSAGAFVQNDATGIYEPLGRRPLTLRDIISVRQTQSDTVEFVRQTSRVNAAAPVPEATTAGAKPNPDNSNTAGTKPEGGFAFEKVTENVVTIAEWVPATRRALSDASQLRGLIDQELRDGLAEEEEDQIVSGSGSGENLTGILETDGVQEQEFVDDIFVTARKAKTKVSTIGRARPTAVLINPEDDEAIDLERDGEDRFYGNGPFGMGPGTLWGLPRVVSEAVPAGTGILGDFRKAVLWDREQANISVTDSHSDFFIRNLIAVLAEERVAFGVIRPKAFVVMDLSGS